MDDEGYEIEMSAAATKQFFDLERDTQVRIKKKVSPLADDLGLRDARS